MSSSVYTGVQSRTVIGPLTTTFTPPAACTTGLLDCPNCAGLFLGYQCLGSGANNPNFIEDATTCWPSASDGAPKPSLPLRGWGFYSPGLICPTGYTSACGATADGHSDWNVQFLMTQGETAVGCCPSGFGCTSTGYQHCTSTALQGDHFPLSECFWDRYAFGSFTLPGTFTPTVKSPTTTFTIGTYGIVAPMVEIVWQSSDRAAMSTSDATVTSSSQLTTTMASSNHTVKSASTTRAAPESTGKSLSPTSNQSHTTSGLSVGETIALSVAIPVVTIAVIVILLFYYRRRRQHSRPALPKIAFDDGGPSHGMSLDKTATATWAKHMSGSQHAGRFQELESERVYEVYGTSPTEMRGR